MLPYSSLLWATHFLLYLTLSTRSSNGSASRFDAKSPKLESDPPHTPSLSHALLVTVLSVPPLSIGLPSSSCVLNQSLGSEATFVAQHLSGIRVASEAELANKPSKHDTWVVDVASGLLRPLHLLADIRVVVFLLIRARRGAERGQTLTCSCAESSRASKESHATQRRWPSSVGLGRRGVVAERWRGAVRVARQPRACC